MMRYDLSLRRVPLDDKLYERDLQVALELSICDSQSERDSTNQSGAGNDDAVFHSTPLPATESTLNKTGEWFSPSQWGLDQCVSVCVCVCK